MSDPLARLFDQFLKERVYLKAVTPKTRVWYETAWKAFKASQAAHGEGGITPRPVCKPSSSPCATVAFVRGL